jgi:hypothetical protein
MQPSVAGSLGGCDLPGEAYGAERAMWINPTSTIVATIDEKPPRQQAAVVSDVVVIDLYIRKMGEDVIV